MINKKDIFETLNARFQDGFLKLSNLPHPSTLKDLDKATLRIQRAIESGEKIVVVGDYDVDGIVASTLMRQFFAHINYPLQLIVPNRFRDGYGISKGIIERLDGVDLIITVDNGISALEAGELCAQKGIDLIITDHHSVPPTLPNAYAIVNPKQSDCDFKYPEICGAQVAWFLIASLKRALKIELDMKEYLDYLALAIVADVMPLTNINRALLKVGLQAIKKSTKSAFVLIRSELGKESLTSEDIGFFIAPLLNSSGRLEDAMLGVEFLCASNLNQAMHAFAKLKELNAFRKELELQITQEALAQVEEDDKIAVVYHNAWHEGVIGIVASRIVDKFNIPAVVLSAHADIYKGSARSYANINLYELFVQTQAHLLGFGGHKMAAGLAIKKEKIAPFKAALHKELEKLDNEDFAQESSVLGEIDFRLIDFELYEILERFEPYGEGNPKPLFFSTNVHVADAREVGENKNHLLLHLRHNGVGLKAFWFNYDKDMLNESINIEYTINKSLFNNEVSLQLYIRKVVV